MPGIFTQHFTYMRSLNTTNPLQDTTIISLLQRMNKMKTQKGLWGKYKVGIQIQICNGSKVCGLSSCHGLIPEVAFMLDFEGSKTGMYEKQHFPNGVHSLWKGTRVGCLHCMRKQGFQPSIQDRKVWTNCPFLWLSDYKEWSYFCLNFLLTSVSTRNPSLPLLAIALMFILKLFPTSPCQLQSAILTPFLSVLSLIFWSVHISS